MFSQFGPLEIVLVIVVLLVIFGPKRLPSLGRQLGRGMREFKDSIGGEDKDKDEQTQAPAISPATAKEPAAAPSSERVPTDATPEQRG